MPVLGQDDVREARGDRVDERDDLVAFLYRQGPARDVPALREVA